MDFEEKIKMFQDVFAPKPKEKILFLIDIPHDTIQDNEAWKDRRIMAQEWYTIFKELGLNTGFSVNWLEYQATGVHNSPIPAEILNTVQKANLAIAMTEYSATSSLLPLCKIPGTITRCASMPGVERRMEKTAFTADYKQVKKIATTIAQMLNDAKGAEILFSTGDKLYVDLRNRIAHADTGDCTQTGQTINFPSGEACKVPYEATDNEININGASETKGHLPVNVNGDILKCVVKNNRIIDIIGQSTKADEMRRFLLENPTRRNLAELGVGCNPKAVITGNVLEDEKVGLHIAYGMSTHLGGKVQSDMHYDICYAKGCPVEGTSMVLLNTDNTKTQIIRKAILRYDLLKN